LPPWFHKLLTRLLSKSCPAGRVHFCRRLLTEAGLFPKLTGDETAWKEISWMGD